MTSDSRQPGLAKLRQRVRAFGAFRRRWDVLRGGAKWLAIAAGSLLAWAVLDALVGLPAWALLSLFAAALIAGLFALIRHVASPLRRRIVDDHEAVLIEQLHGGMDNQVIGALQLGRDIAGASDRSLGYSRELAEELVRRSAANIEKANPEKLIDLRPAKKALIVAAAVLVACVVPAVAVPAFASNRAHRLVDAWASVLDAIFPVTMTVQPGDVAILRGSAVKLRVAITGSRRDRVELLRTNAAGEKTTEDLTIRAGEATMPIAAVTEEFTYRFRYGSRETPTHRVRVGDRPEISAINFEVGYPAYTGVPPRTIVGRVARLQGLASSTVQVSVAANAPLSPDLCYVQWQDGSRQPMVITGRFASFGFNLERADRATVRLTGALGKGFEMDPPYAFDVTVDRDTPPAIEIALKNRSLTMLADEATRFAVNWAAEDDFGVAEVSLDYRIDTVDPLLNRPLRTGSLSRKLDPPRDRAKGQFTNIFESLGSPLEPGDRVTLTLSAKDNNTETGPGIGRAAPVVIVIVRPDLAGFTEQQYAFGVESALGGLKKVRRASNLLAEAERTVRQEAKRDIERQDVKSRASGEAFPSGAEDSIGDYFRLLSGER